MSAVVAAFLIVVIEIGELGLIGVFGEFAAMPVALFGAVYHVCGEAEGHYQGYMLVYREIGSVARMADHDIVAVVRGTMSMSCPSRFIIKKGDQASQQKDKKYV